MPSTTNVFKPALIAVAVSLTLACAGPASDQKQTDSTNSDANHSQVADEHARQAQEAEYQARAQAQQNMQAQQRLAGSVKSMASQQQFAVRSASSQFMPPPPVEMHYYREDGQIVGDNRENYQDIDENPVKLVEQSPLSTFSVDVDTGSYANVRRMLVDGHKPPKDSVRVEEFINYFDYAYPAPQDLSQPFSISTDVAVAPWNKQRHLIRIGLQGYQGELQNNGKNLVFLIDVSGSMGQPNKLPLLKRAMLMLSQQLTDKDTVSIVVYAGASGVVLEPTAGNDTVAIETALTQLSAGGSTNGASGIELAYQMAKKGYIEGGVNRVLLATDGDFNVGTVDHDQLIEMIEAKRDEGIALTTLGFGTGNYNDYLMEQLSNAGNGNYAYIDTLNEARKVLVDELSANMQIIAKDVKVQIEFNPNQVAEYRLIGYENRVLAKEDFNNDKVDAGDIGAGHSVTALYEITLVDSDSRFTDPLRYQHTDTVHKSQSNELAHVKLRYKQPDATSSKLVERVILRDDITEFNQQSSDFQFATAVAGFAQLVRQSKFTSDIDYDWVIEVANQNKGVDEFGYRTEFVQLVRNARALRPTSIK